MYNNEELTQKVHLLKELKRTQEDLSTRITNLENEIKADMTEKNVSELIGEDWTVTWSSIESKRFDQSRFAAAHPDLFESFRALSTSRRFSVK